MASDELKRIARARIVETLGKRYVQGVDATELVDALAYSLARGCLVILDSKSHTVLFRNK
jgi:hypothetical protein